MNSDESALRALRTQVHFDLAQTGAQVAHATQLSATAKNQVVSFTQCQENTASELRRVMMQMPINPALLDAMRDLHDVELRGLRDAKTRFATAEQKEHEARVALADLRSRDRALERALHAVLRKQQLKQEVKASIDADDLWLQQNWQEMS